MSHTGEEVQVEVLAWYVREKEGYSSVVREKKECRVESVYGREAEESTPKEGKNTDKRGLGRLCNLVFMDM